MDRTLERSMTLTRTDVPGTAIQGVVMKCACVFRSKAGRRQLCLFVRGRRTPDIAFVRGAAASQIGVWRGCGRFTKGRMAGVGKVHKRA